MISVCIATYNGEKYIKEQLMSILLQIGEKDEIIVSDDHSSDDTIQIILSICDSRIKIVTNEGDKGYTSNFQNALLHAKGDYVFLSDQDDVWTENKVNYCINQLQKYDFVVSDAVVVDQNKNIISTSYFLERKIYHSLVGNIYRFGFLGCCMAFRKDVLSRALPFPKNHHYCTHDNWLFLVAKVFYKVNISSEKLILYRRHSSNASTGGFVNRTSLSFKICYRFYLLYHLLRLKLL